jgi:hypothetical protein
MAFSAGEYDQRSLDRRDLDLLRNDPCVRHIMPTGVSDRSGPHEEHDSAVVSAGLFAQLTPTISNLCHLERGQLWYKLLPKNLDRSLR